jgi:hypothetical protein
LLLPVSFRLGAVHHLVRLIVGCLPKADVGPIGAVMGSTQMTSSEKSDIKFFHSNALNRDLVDAANDAQLLAIDLSKRSKTINTAVLAALTSVKIQC